MRKATTKKNPDPISTFASLAGGVASTLAIHDMVTRKRKPAPKRVTRGTAKASARTVSNPKRQPKKGTLYVLTIRRGDDVETVYLHDGKGDGFSRKFRSMAGARAYANRHKYSLAKNPQSGTHAIKRNVKGFIDGAGVFHPIRGSADYDDVRAGEHKPFTSRRTVVSKAAKKRLGIKTVAAKPKRKPVKRKTPAKTAAQGTLFNPRPQRKVTRAKNTQGLKRAVRRHRISKTHDSDVAKQRASGRRRNPASPTNARRKTFEMFQGRRCEIVKSLPVSRHAGANAKMDQLGKLHEIKLLRGPVIKFNPAKHVLAAMGGRLWIVGPPKHPSDVKQNPNVLNPIGHVDHVVYETFKPHHGDPPRQRYIHKLGEEGGTLPLYCLDSDGFPVLKGGQYKIRREGIRD